MNLLLFKLTFPDTADRAHPIIRKGLECGSGCDSIVGIASRRVINVATRFANILLHLFSLIFKRDGHRLFAMTFQIVAFWAFLRQ